MYVRARGREGGDGASGTFLPTERLGLGKGEGFRSSYIMGFICIKSEAKLSPLYVPSL